MIKIEFTCKVCGKVEEITPDDIDEKTIVPVCDACYGQFEAQKGKLIKSFKKKMVKVYEVYGIPAETFNAGEEIEEL